MKEWEIQEEYKKFKEAKEEEEALPLPLSGRFEESFAYRTIKDRLPVILTKVIDNVTRFRDKVRICQEMDKHSFLQDEDVTRLIINNLAELRYEMTTNKPIRALLSSAPDVVHWNNYIKFQHKLYDFEPCWFNSPWLFVECYLYRRIHEAFEINSKSGNTYDPFSDQKSEAFINCEQSSIKLAETLLEVVSSEAPKKTKSTDPNNEVPELTKPKNFDNFIQISLWGNRCDLSLSAGTSKLQSDNPFDQVDILKSNIIVNDIEDIWHILYRENKKSPGTVMIDVILDNAGFELFCDFCLFEYLTELKIVNKVRFYVKTCPWYVSDTTTADIKWLLIHHFGKSNDNNLHEVFDRWNKRFQNQVWTIEKEMFWTLPYDYNDMQKVCPELYLKLSESNLIIFKGDLNYRKLTFDRLWDPTTSFKTALRNFLPTSLCALRTIKSDVVTNISTSKKQFLDKLDSQWLFSGEYALIQCLLKNEESNNENIEGTLASSSKDFKS